MMLLWRKDREVETKNEQPTRHGAAVGIGLEV